jgi:D-psicose/D-tagatose/L-ribulose 3-epimerase
MHNWMRSEALETTLARLARFGYDGIEIMGEPAEYDAGEVKELLRKHNLNCWGAVTLTEKGRDLISGDKYVRLGTIRYMKDCLSFAADLGGEVLTVVPCLKTVPMSSPDNEWRWAIEGLKDCQEHAEKVGVRMAIEPLNRFETYFINRHDQAMELAERVGGNCGVCLDFYQMCAEETSWEEALSASAGRLANVHIADTNRMPPGQGSIEWAKALRALEQTGYTGYLSVEFLAQLDRVPRNHQGKKSGAAGSAGLRTRFPVDDGSGVMAEQDYDRLVQETIEYMRAV